METKEQYLNFYEIMNLDMETLKTEVKRCLIEGNEDYLNELFIYGCWGNKSELVNSDGDAISKGISLLHRKGFSILSAIEKNYSGKVIKKFLNGGADPNLKDNNGETTLMFAAKIGATQAVQELLKHRKIKPNLKNEDGVTALMEAAWRGRTQAVQELLKRPDINPNLQDRWGQTALMLAAVNRKTQAVQELLKHPKIKPNLKDKNGYTALIKAAEWGCALEIQELLKHPDTDPNLKDKDGYTALMYATMRGRAQAVQELLKHPAIDVSLTNNDDETAWDLAEAMICKEFPELHPRYKDDNIKNNQIILLKEISKELSQLISTDVKDKERIRAITLLIKKL